MNTIAITITEEELVEFLDKLDELSGSNVKINKRVIRLQRWLSSMFRLFRFTRYPIVFSLFRNKTMDIDISVEEDLTVVIQCSDAPQWVRHLDELYNKYQLRDVSVV